MNCILFSFSQTLQDNSKKNQPAGILSSGSHVKIQDKLAEIKRKALLQNNHSKEFSVHIENYNNESKECLSPECKQKKLLNKALGPQGLEHQRNQRWNDKSYPRIEEGKQVKLDSVKDIKKTKHKDVEQGDILINYQSEENDGKPHNVRDNIGNVPIYGAENAINIDLSQLPRGVHIPQAQYYLRDSTFTCLHSKVGQMV